MLAFIYNQKVNSSLRAFNWDNLQHDKPFCRFIKFSEKKKMVLQNYQRLSYVEPSKCENLNFSQAA